MPVLSRPRAQFAHQRTVRLIVDKDLTDIDALKLAQSLPDYSGEIKGIVPLFGGKCFDITLATAEAAIKLAQEGFDYENTHKPLCLLGQRSIHVSIFVSVEFLDEDLLTLLATYGKLKSNTVHGLYFTEEGYTHIENGIRVVQFNKIARDIPKRMVLGGLEIGFKYSGQPVTCHRCHLTEHVVKNCPKKRVLQKNRPETTETPQAENNTAEVKDMDTAPGLFTQPKNSSYAEAASNQSDIPGSNVSAQPPRQWDFLSKQTATEEAMEGPEVSRDRKRDVPSPSTSDDERGPTPKKSLTPATSTVTKDQPLKPVSPNSTVESSPPEAAGKSCTTITTEHDFSSDPAGLRHFISALDAAGWQRSALVKAVPGGVYYCCRAYYLQHKHGNFTEARAKKAKATSQVCKSWGVLSGTIPQDAYAKLLENFLTLQKEYKIFTSDKLY